MTVSFARVFLALIFAPWLASCGGGGGGGDGEGGTRYKSRQPRCVSRRSEVHRCLPHSN